MLLFFVSLFLLSGAVYGQEKPVSNDVLIALIEEKSENTDIEVARIVRLNRKHASDSEFYTTLEIVRDYYVLSAQYKKGISTGTELIQLAKKLKRNEALALHYNKLIFPTYITGAYEKQYDFTKRAMYYAEQSKDTIELIVATGHMGTFFWYIDELDKAVEWNKKAFDLALKYPECKDRAIILNNRGHYYLKSGKYQDAIQTLKRAIQFAEKRYDSSISYSTLGTTYYHCDSLELSEKYLKLSRELATGNKQEVHLTGWLYDMGSLSYKKGNYTEAENYLVQAAEEALKSSSIEYLQQSYFKLHEVAMRLGNESNALQYILLSNQYEDSLEATQNISELASRYYKSTILTKEREKEKTKRLAAALKTKVEAEQEARFFSNIAMIVSIIGLIILGFWGWNYRKLQRLKQQRMQRQFSDKLELKNKQLASINIRNINRSNYMREVDSKLTKASNRYNRKSDKKKEELEQELHRIRKMIESESTFEWEDFRYYFEQINEGYLTRVQTRHPKITNHDKKIISYIKTGLDPKQIAQLLNVTDATAYTQRYRLRKKLGLSAEEDLVHYLTTAFEPEEK